MHEDQHRHDAEGDERKLEVAAGDEVDDDDEADDVAEDGQEAVDESSSCIDVTSFWTRDMTRPISLLS